MTKPAPSRSLKKGEKSLLGTRWGHQQSVNTVNNVLNAFTACYAQFSAPKLESNGYMGLNYAVSGTLTQKDSLHENYVFCTLSDITPYLACVADSVAPTSYLKHICVRITSRWGG